MMMSLLALAHADPTTPSHLTGGYVVAGALTTHAVAEIFFAPRLADELLVEMDGDVVATAANNGPVTVMSKVSAKSLVQTACGCL